MKRDAKVICMIGELSRGACEMLLDQDLPDSRFPDISEVRANIRQQHLDGVIPSFRIIYEWECDA